MATTLGYRSDERALATKDAQEPVRPGVSRASRVLFRLAQACAFVAGFAMILTVALWGDTSPGGLNVHVAALAALLPVALALHQLLRTRLSEILLAVGAAGLLRFVVIGILLAQGVISTQQESDTLHLAWAAYASWLVITNILLVRSRALPRLIPVIGVVAGILFAGAELAWSQGLLIDWRNNPSLANEAQAVGTRGNMLSLAASLVVPVWSFGLTFVLGSRAPKTMAGIGRAILIEPLLLAG